jgi:hypothetical protein
MKMTVTELYYYTNQVYTTVAEELQHLVLMCEQGHWEKTLSHI